MACHPGYLLQAEKLWFNSSGHLCWDNAVMERFFLNLKRVWQRDYVNPAEARTDITDDIVGLYNVRRIHSTCPIPSKNSAQQTPLGTQTKGSEKI
ncbi:MAG: hypothetical protein B7Z82_01375 [Halothiobacillus sp. 20-54-6]|nr:MAG: hypothetical protein B7Z82_01375 [Halothiobacillus sp. 20-54-6]